jgi:hypothetical protein
MSDYEKCLAISDDCARDARENDGKPFTGKSFGEVTGNILAMVATLAEITARLLEDNASTTTNQIK